MNARQRRIRPGSGLMLLAGLALGCGGSGGEANQPPPAPATAEQGEEASKSVYEGMPKGIKSPGVAKPR